MPDLSNLRRRRTRRSRSGDTSDPALKAPFFVVGTPRSGTTYLQRVLMSHPDIFCTDETRVMTAVARALRPLGSHSHAEETRQVLVAHLREAVLDLFVRLGARLDEQRWGDKHPHYVDPNHPAALDAIELLFPDAQLVWMRRRREEVASSIRKMGWAPDRPEEPENVWDRTEAFREEVTSHWADRLLTVDYEELPDAVDRILEFLDVAVDEQVVGYARESWRRARFSDPTSW